ncbi:reverse transcriptase, partial [Phytophthora megakarya]
MIERGLLSSAAVDDTPRSVRRRGHSNPRRPRVLSSDSVGTESEIISVLVESSSTSRVCDIEVAHPPRDAAEITQLPDLPWKHFLSDLKKGDIEQVCMLVHKATACAAAVEVDADDPASDTGTRPKGAEPKSAREARYAAQSLPALEASGNPVAPLVREYIDIFPDKVPPVLPPDCGVQHKIDLVPGSKYCATRQWPLPRDQVEAIDAFFESRRQAGHMVLDTMSGSTKYSAIDLMDGFYQIPMREEDMPLTAVSTQSGMLWEWLVMAQGLKNAPATLNRMVRVEDGMTDVEVHLDHLRQVFEVMRENKLYANLKKCIFCAPEIPVLGSYDQKQLRQWLGLATYLHHYSKNFALTIQPLSQLLKADVTWSWRPEHQTAFDDHSKPFHVVCDASDFAIGCALMQFDDEGRERVVSYQSRLLKQAERNCPVHDTELLAMRYALIKFRVYLLGEKTFTIYTDHASLRTPTKSPHLSQRMARWLSLFSEYNFVVHYKPGKTNILADALSRRPDYVRSGRHANGDEDDDDCAVCVAEGVAAVEVAATSPLRDLISAAYGSDAECAEMLKYLRDPSNMARRRLSSRSRARVDRYALDGNLLTYCVDHSDPPRIVLPLGDDLRARLIHEFHDIPSGGHLGREKTFASLSGDFYWPHMYKSVRKWVRSSEACQRVKPSPSNQAPLRPLPVATDPWSSVSMDFAFGLPRDAHDRTGVLVFVDRFSKMV